VHRTSARSVRPTFDIHSSSSGSRRSPADPTAEGTYPAAGRPTRISEGGSTGVVGKTGGLTLEADHAIGTVRSRETPTENQSSREGASSMPPSQTMQVSSAAEQSMIKF